MTEKIKKKERMKDKDNKRKKDINDGINENEKL